MQTTSTTTAAATVNKVVALTRVFRLGSLSLADPNAALPPEEAMQLYALSYPVIVTSTLGDPFVEGDSTLVYPINKGEVKTKG